VDALASGAEEGRASLRKALGSWQRSVDPEVSEWGNLAGVMSRRAYLNEIGWVVGTGGTETSQYLEEEKTSVILLVVVSERGTAQTGGVSKLAGVAPSG
jgi:hypothetical protein